MASFLPMPRVGTLSAMILILVPTVAIGDVGSKLIMTGSSTVAPLAQEIGHLFESQFSGTRIDVQSGGSSRGIGDARSGMADIGLVSRDLTPDERDLRSFTIARDGIGIVVHKDNLVRALDDAQIVKIFTGKVKNWRDVGGADRTITVVTKAEGRSTLELFLGYFHLKPADINAAVIVGENAQAIKTIAGNPDAIGYVSIGSAESEIIGGVPIALLPLGGVPATEENVGNGRFPLSRPLNLVTKGLPTGLAKQFIEFAMSTRVNGIVKSQHFVPPSAKATN